MPCCARSQTLPPSPPSPPSGPPKGTNFSRRKPIAPRPPWPARTFTIASSTNFIATCRLNEKPRTRRGFPRDSSGPALFRQDAHEGAPVGALLSELDAARLEREQRVVGADAHVLARAVRRAALAHEDVAGEDFLAAELLHAEPLRLGLAAVLGTAACFLVCHVAFLVRPP